MRKNKIVLSDYPYQRDIEIRLLLATLTKAEGALLNELFLHCLEIPLTDLSHALNISEGHICQMLGKFSTLCRIEGSKVILDKEMRRYFEGELTPFEEHFEPGICHLQRLLKKVSPFTLLKWYSLPRLCDKIIPTIIQKHCSQPKVYEQYLQQLQFADPTAKKIIDRVFAPPHFKMTAQAIQESLSLTLEQFHEWIIFLEFHFVLCLSYEQRGEGWQQIVTPFHEWREYLLFQYNTLPQPILDISEIRRTDPRDFGFCEDMERMLQRIKLAPVQREVYDSSLVERALFMHFVTIEEDHLVILPLAEEWLARDMVEKALSMTRHPIQVEKGLKKVLHRGWVTVEDFLRGFTEVLRGKEPIALTQQGKRWKYSVPIYTSEERDLIEKTLLHRLFEAGIVATGTYRGMSCFCVTSFGLSLFE